MFLEIKDIGDESLSVDQSIELGDPRQSGDDEIELLEVRLQGSARRGERGVEFAGRLTSRLRHPCVRCLAPFEIPVDGEFFLVLVPDAVEFGTGDTELVEDDTNLFYAARGKADLGEIAREQISLNLPLKPLCRPDCRGLCPGCGANRNRLECGCQSEVLDLRLAPLLDLKRKLGRS